MAADPSEMEFDHIGYDPRHTHVSGLYTSTKTPTEPGRGESLEEAAGALDAEERETDFSPQEENAMDSFEYGDENLPPAQRHDF